ncbi:hypothetical protein [Rhodococcus gannanensis]|uniref:Uncharacterized protein n=1 Tax=Rhodococcus gannanensis TaxID=1960308 RepID=A0ABW4P6T6_9NOCA
MPTAPTPAPPDGANPPLSRVLSHTGPSQHRTMSRRAALRFGAVAIGATAAAAGVAGCSSAEDEHDAEPDPLLTALDAARRDADAAAAGAAVTPDRAGALAVIAAERTAHADALAAEIARAAGEDPTSPSTTTTAATTTAAPVTPPTVDALRSMLAESQRGAASLARSLDGYRAGLTGSISAAVGAQQAVLLR